MLEGAFPGATGVHLGFQGHGVMETTERGKGNEGSEGGQYGTRGATKMSVATAARAGSRVCILGHIKGEIGQHRSVVKRLLRISLLADTGDKGMCSGEMLITPPSDDLHFTGNETGIYSHGP